MRSDLVSNEQIVRAARRNLASGEWDYLVGGSESETTMMRNRAFRRIGFRPRLNMPAARILKAPGLPSGM